MHIAKPLAAAAALGLVLSAAPVRAEVSFMYAEWLSDLVEPGIEAFEKETGETVNAIRLPNQGFVERTALDLAAGTAADVIQVDSYVVSELASSGYLAPLDNFVGGWDQFETYTKAVLDVVSHAGSVYGLPTDTDVRMLWYNKQVFAEAGLDVPWQPQTWDDVVNAAETIREKTGIEQPILLPAGTKQAESATMEGFYMVLLGADTPENDRNRLRNREEGKWIADSPALRRAFGLFHEIYVERDLGATAMNYAADINATDSEALLSGNLAILSSGSWETTCFWGCSGDSVPPREEREAIVGWAPFPGSGQPGANEISTISGGWALGLNANSDKKDLGFQLITTIFDRANFADWTIKNRRMAVRGDIANSEEYLSNPFLAAATELVAHTTGRDTYPGYQVVSSFIQQGTADILDGASVDDVMREYHDALVDEFGEENVITYD